MDKETFLQRLTDIGMQEDDVERRTMIDELRNEAEALYTTNETLTTSNNQYIEANEKLREANMKLFLREGVEKKTSVQDDLPVAKEPEKLKFEDLFNDKGGIK